MSTAPALGHKYEATAFPLEATLEEKPADAVETPVEGEAEPEAAPAEEQVETPAEPAAEEPAADEQPSLTDEAVESYGFSREEAEAYGDNLPKVLARLDKQAMDLMRKELAEAAPAPAVEKPAEKPKEPAAPQVQFKKIEVADLGVNADDFTDEQAKAFENVVKELNHNREVIAALTELAIGTHGKVGEITTQHEVQSEAAIARDMDAFFSEIADERYGKSPLAVLKPSSELVANRQKFYAEVQLLQQSDAREGKSPASLTELSRRAYRVLNEDKLIASARKTVGQEVAARRKQAIASPGGRNNKPLDPRARALAVIKEKLELGALGRN